jgi:pyrroline-5-carboxylate reductase
MAKSIIAGITSSDIEVSRFYLFDKNQETYSNMQRKDSFVYSESIESAVAAADTVLLSVKPQNYPEVLSKISENHGYEKKLYISIAAGITSQSVSDSLNGADVIRVLPNLPMIIGKGVSIICSNQNVDNEKFQFVCNIFASAGSNIIINEEYMNAMIGVTSSSPAYVFKFINAIYEGAIVQGISDGKELMNAICDVVIGSAEMLKASSESPKALVDRVASKGGTTERALSVLDSREFDSSIIDAMRSCTERANELGAQKK